MITRNPRVSLAIDRLEISYRFGKDNSLPQKIIEDVLRYHRQLGIHEITFTVGAYREDHSRYKRYTIKMRDYPYTGVFIEIGTAINQNGRFPYAKFGFNPTNIARYLEARSFFLSLMQDFFPGGGYSELINDGYVLYTEYAIDFNFIDITQIDICSPALEHGLRFGENNQAKTICLKELPTKKRQLEFTAYDKREELKKKHARYIRRPLVRVEAKRRFQYHTDFSKDQGYGAIRYSQSICTATGH